MRHPYADFIHKVDKPARYLGGEYQSVRKNLDAVDVTMVLGFPDLYDIGMSHMGTKILYSLLNKHPRIAAERCFARILSRLGARSARIMSKACTHADSSSAGSSALPGRISRCS